MLERPRGERRSLWWRHCPSVASMRLRLSFERVVIVLLCLAVLYLITFNRHTRDDSPKVRHSAKRSAVRADAKMTDSRHDDAAEAKRQQDQKDVVEAERTVGLQTAKDHVKEDNAQNEEASDVRPRRRKRRRRIDKDNEETEKVEEKHNEDNIPDQKPHEEPGNDDGGERGSDDLAGEVAGTANEDEEQATEKEKDAEKDAEKQKDDENDDAKETQGTENEADGDGDDDDDDDDSEPTGAEKKALQSIYEARNRTTPSNLTEVERRAAERKRHLSNECERRGLKHEGWSRVPANVLVSDKFKVMYCMVGKVASSTWKKVFLMAAGKIAVSRADEFQHRSVGARALKVLKPMTGRRSPRNEQRMSTYFKFMFVRHPFDRLVSAFKEKFRLVDEYQQTYGRRIIRTYRRNASAESLTRGHDVTLEEFVRFMGDRGRSTKNIHWTPQYDLCFPCSIQYDFVGHYETLWDDGDYVLQRLGVDGIVSFPRWNRTSKAGQRSEDMLAGVRPEYLKRLRKLYTHDFDFFGYK